MDEAKSGDATSSIFEAAKSAGLKPVLLEKRGPGRPAGSGKPKKAAAKDEAESFRDEVFTPETMEGIVELPFDIAQAATGWDGWELSESERKILSTTGATAAKHFVSLDPKWIALSIFGLTFLKLLGVRAMAYKTWARNEAKKGKPDATETKAA